MDSKTVYVVSEHFDNCESYDLHDWSDRVIAVMETRAEAEEVVKKLYDGVLSITVDEYGQPMTATKRYFEDNGELEDVLLENVEGYSRSSGSYSYWIEEYELGTINE